MQEIEFKIVKKWMWKGKQCVIIKGVWCNQVKQIASSLHDWYCGYAETNLSEDYNKVDINVHGGLTFGGTLDEFKNKRFYGFDTAHAFDNTPKVQNLEYVTKEVESMVEQLIELEKKII